MSLSNGAYCGTFDMAQERPFDLAQDRPASILRHGSGQALTVRKDYLGSYASWSSGSLG
jgi:hypothetical protein